MDLGQYKQWQLDKVDAMLASFSADENDLRERMKTWEDEQAPGSGVVLDEGWYHAYVTAYSTDLVPVMVGHVVVMVGTVVSAITDVALLQDAAGEFVARAHNRGWEKGEPVVLVGTVEADYSVRVMAAWSSALVAGLGHDRFTAVMLGVVQCSDVPPQNSGGSPSPNTRPGVYSHVRVPEFGSTVP